MRHLISIVFSICFFAFSSQAQKTWTLEECAAYALSNNITIKQSQLSEQINEYSVTQSKLNLLPSLNANTGYFFNFGKTIDPTTNLFVNQNTQTNTVQLSLSWPLFTGFQRWNTLKQNEYSLLASEANTQNTEQTVLLYVAGGFLDIVYAKENLANAENLERLSQQQLDRTNALVQAGTLAQGMLYDIQAQVARDELNRVNAKNQLDLAVLNLTQLMNLSEPVEISVPNIEMSNQLLQQINLTSDSIYAIALQTQAVIRNAEYNLLSSEKTLAVSKGGQYPTLSFFGSLSTNYSNAFDRLTSIDTVLGAPREIGYVGTTGDLVYSPQFDLVPTFSPVAYGDQLRDNFGQAFGFSLDIPIFNNWTARTNISRSKIDVISAQYDLDAAKQQLYKNVQTAYQDAVAAKNSYEASLKNVTALEKAFNDAQMKFNLGSIQSLDYTTAQNNLAVAQSELLQAKYRYIFRLKVLDLYQGKPLTLE